MRGSLLHRILARRGFALVLAAALALGPAGAHAARRQDENTILGMSRVQFAITTAILITGLRVAAVFLVGNSFLGRSVGTGLMALYLGHVVAEGAIYGVTAGAGAYALGAAGGGPGTTPPHILPQRLAKPPPLPPRLPLRLGG